MNSYREIQIEGWPVQVGQDLLRRHAATSDAVLKLLGHHLFHASRTMPRPALRKLRRVTIWVEWNTTRTSIAPCMCYHPGTDWLREHGVRIEKARGIEVTHARHFLNWTIEQPAMVIHELAHAYHHQFLENGFDNPEVRKAFESARRSRRYSRVLRTSGRVGRAYAMTNPMEYFAEAAEALFGTCDFYPFVRAELKRHDPKGYRALCRLWGLSAG